MGSPDLSAANQQWARLKSADMPHLQRWLAHVGAHPVLKATVDALGPKTKEQHMQAIADAGYGGGGEFPPLLQIGTVSLKPSGSSTYKPLQMPAMAAVVGSFLLHLLLVLTLVLHTRSE